MAFALPAVYFALEEVIVWASAVVAGAAVGVVASKAMTKKQEERFKSRAPTASRTGKNKGCPPHNYFGGKEIGYVAAQLGMHPRALGNALHKIKQRIPNNPVVVFCIKCGDVFTDSNEWIGNLLD